MDILEYSYSNELVLLHHIHTNNLYYPMLKSAGSLIYSAATV